MNLYDSLERLYDLAKHNEVLKEKLLHTEAENNSILLFCKIAEEAGVSISPIDLISEGQEAYAAMRRSTNGGGENAPMLDGEDDYYELFLARLRSR